MVSRGRQAGKLPLACGPAAAGGGALLLLVLLGGGGAALRQRGERAPRAAGATTAPRFAMCDARWGETKMGVVSRDSSTAARTSSICAEGCALSSIASGLRWHGIQLSGVDATPASLNEWLQALPEGEGYECAKPGCYVARGWTNWQCDCNQIAALALTRLPGVKLVGQQQEAPRWEDLRRSLSGAEGRRVIAGRIRHTAKPVAWSVLLTGTSVARDGTREVLVSDPTSGGANASSYQYERLADILFDYRLPS
eukprot:TRINITY_DN56437_c0_g1_i1.p1 TRINITY_DN56437_c0_g1~~TRINITY_DN56437_c0_g1_i1.p1  ORF type:complete len:253 (+),score=17.10 TRINITY_DN56437_c0_g1_i1:72-830(+)